MDQDTYNKNAVMAFNAYSPSADMTAPVIYVNYGTQDDYQALEAMGISVEGKIAIARYGRCYRGIKAKLAEEHKAVGLIIYSDPQDDGYFAGDVFPRGPWRPMSGIQRGSVQYTRNLSGRSVHAGSGGNAGREAPGARRCEEFAAYSDAADQRARRGGDSGRSGRTARSARLAGSVAVHVSHRARWRGGAYEAGDGLSAAPIYDVIAKLRGTDDGEWVLLGNHHDAWVYGAVDPGSGTASMLETARALGELARTAGSRSARSLCANGMGKSRADRLDGMGGGESGGAAGEGGGVHQHGRGRGGAEFYGFRDAFSERM